MQPVKIPNRMKCPECSGKGTIVASADDYLDDFRLPDFTGAKHQCESAVFIRRRFVLEAMVLYSPDVFQIFLKFVRYESYWLFWNKNKGCSVSELANRLLQNNPEAFELFAKMEDKVPEIDE